MTAVNGSLDFSINDGASFPDHDIIVIHTVNITHFFRIVPYVGLVNNSYDFFKLLYLYMFRMLRYNAHNRGQKSAVR